MDFIINLIILLLIGYILGHERQVSCKIIGIRSITLVLLGAFIFTYMSTIVGGDPARIIAQVATGISFVGAGMIYKNKGDNISNLTTAILIWVLAALGCLVALGLIKESIVLTITIYFILHFYKKLFNYGDR